MDSYCTRTSIVELRYRRVGSRCQFVSEELLEEAKLIHYG